MKKFTVLLASFGLLVLLSGCSFFTKSPDVVLEKMKKAMVDIDSFHMQAVIDIEGTVSEDAFGIQGTTELADPQTVNAQLTIDGDVVYTSLESPDSSYNVIGSIELPDGLQFNLDLDSITKDGIAYTRFNKVPTLGFIDFSKVSGQWFLFDTIADAELLTGQGGDESVNEAKPLTKEQEDELKKLVEETNFFTVTEDHGVDELNGKSVYHYILGLNKEEIIRFSKEAHQITEGVSLPDEDIQSLTETLNSLEAMNFEAYVGKKDFRIYRVVFNGNITLDDVEDPVYVNAQIDIDDYNNGINIEAPADAREFSIEEVMSFPLFDFSPDDLYDNADELNTAPFEGFSEDDLKQFEIDFEKFKNEYQGQ